MMCGEVAERLGFWWDESGTNVSRNPCRRCCRNAAELLQNSVESFFFAELKNVSERLKKSLFDCWKVVGEIGGKVERDFSQKNSDQFGILSKFRIGFL